MHETKSRGYSTELMLAELDGEVTVGDGFFAVRSPMCPTFWWGNFVLFPGPPSSGCVDDWEATFATHVGCVPGVRHKNFAWDTIAGEEGAADEFEARGYTIDRGVYLQMFTAPEELPLPDGPVVRQVRGDSEWAQLAQLHDDSLVGARATESFRAFQANQVLRFQRLTDSGHGRWFGAFVGEEMVATMGLVVHEGLGRCQAVGTAPNHRRRGYATTLVREVCRTGFGDMAADEIVIMTDIGNPAAHVYRSVGFGAGANAEELVVSVSMPGS